VSGALDGLVVVVTRPARQAARFIGLLERHGAQSVAFPTIAIEPVSLEPGVHEALAAGAFDWIIYTSANAVAHAPPIPGSRARIAAIGRATARALESSGRRVAAMPSTGADTEGLLAHHEFADLAARRVLIVKGVGGRDALRAGLADRGATVVTAEVYRRVPAEPVAGAIEALDRACRRATTVVAITSVEVLDSLLALAASRVPQLPAMRLLVPGERVAEAARRHEWRGPILVARSAEDEAMLEALLSGPDGGSPADRA
jgi:uroporphyrinogen-III synthase